MTAEAMRARFEAICAEHRITFTYSADSWRWAAKVRSRHVTVPPCCDEESLACALHEAAHVVVGDCPGTALHFDRRRHGSASCIECERLAWATAQRWVTFTPRMTACMRRWFKTYRHVPAPVEAQKAADRALGVVAVLAEDLARLKFADKLARNARARR